MTVSIVIPLYNKAPYFKRTLESIRAQTVTDYEVIVVDDGSTDGGARLVAALDDPRFRVIVQANGGPGRARNRGLCEASGEYVTFLDADDEWLPAFLETGVGLLEQHGPGVAAVCQGYFEYPSGRSTERLWRRRGLSPGPCRLDPATPPARAVSLLAYMSPWSTLLRTEVVRRWGGFFDRRKCLYGEDAFLWLKILLNETIFVSLEPLVCYHREASALTGNLGGPRPVEPFLTDPEEITTACPPELSGLLTQVLAYRALKTACVLGYWGCWREARVLLRRFCRGVYPSTPWILPAWICASPLGPPFGRAWRRLRSPGNSPVPTSRHRIHPGSRSGTESGAVNSGSLTYTDVIEASAEPT
jgi:GT2 family glycosyltransferase